MSEHELLKIIDNELIDCDIEFAEDNEPGEMTVTFHFDTEEKNDWHNMSGPVIMVQKVKNYNAVIANMTIRGIKISHFKI